MTKLSTYIRRNTGFYILGISGLVISIVLDMLTPQITKQLVDEVIIQKKVELLTKLLLGYLAIGVGRAIFRYIKEFSFDSSGSKIACLIRRDLFKYMQTLSANFFDKNNSGELMSRIKDDIDRIWDGLVFIGMLLLEVLIHTSIILYCMFSMSWKLSIIPTISMLVAALIAIFMEKKLGKVYGDIEQESSILNNVASENLAGVRTVKAFAREKFEINKFLKHNNQFYELNVSQSRVFVKYYPILQTITYVMPCIVMLQGGYMVIKNKFSIGELSAYLQYATNITWPMEMLGWLMNGLSAAIAAWKRIKKVYAQVPNIQNCDNPIILNQVKGDITFSHVDFSISTDTESMQGGFEKDKKTRKNKKQITDITTTIPQEKEILHDISFTVKKGQTLGIMGTTGSGKSSISNLLSRIYDVSSGTITLDGVDIRKLTISQLRQSISPVMQDVFLFSDSINENVLFGKRKFLTLSDTKHAIDQAEASEFVNKLNEGYDTIIGERGVGLSGGQKQRLTIARALAKKSPVIIFDDSTSALDMETEQKLQQTVEQMTDVTKIIIAHRISAVRKANEIIILDKGKIAERGTHEELLARKGLYYQTWQSQYGTYSSPEEAK